MLLCLYIWEFPTFYSLGRERVMKAESQAGNGSREPSGWWGQGQGAKQVMGAESQAGDGSREPSG